MEIIESKSAPIENSNAVSNFFSCVSLIRNSAIVEATNGKLTPIPSNLMVEKKVVLSPFSFL